LNGQTRPPYSHAATNLCMQGAPEAEAIAPLGGGNWDLGHLGRVCQGRHADLPSPIPAALSPNASAARLAPASRSGTADLSARRKDGHISCRKNHRGRGGDPSFRLDPGSGEAIRARLDALDDRLGQESATAAEAE
jgi:hypothetical protein